MKTARTAFLMHLLYLSMLVALLAGCQDPIAKLVNKRFPPVDEGAQRQKAIDSTAAALSSIKTANVAASIPISDLQKALYTAELKNAGVEEFKLEGDDQLIRIQIGFKREFNAADSPADAKLAGMLDQLKPRVEGKIEMVFGVSGGVVSTNATGEPSLQLQILPSLSQIVLSKVAIADKLDATATVEWLTRMMTRYRDNISGALARHPLTTISLPVATPAPIDITEALNVTSAGNRVDVKLTAQPVDAPVKFHAIAWLVDQDRLTAIVQFTPLDWTSDKPGPQVEHSFRAIKGQINGIVRDSFGATEVKESWVGVRKELIATSLNSIVRQASACLQASGRTHLNEAIKIPIPSADAVSCSSDRDCQSKRECTFSANRDTRDCETCILSRPVLCSPKICAFGGCVGGGCTGGGCIQRGNDPFCEAAKAAQNVIYDADANLRKADCDRLREMETAACHVEVTGAKLLCEAGKETLKALKRTGNFANIDLDVDVQAKSVQVCLKDFSFAPGLDNVALKLGVNGDADVDVGLKFTPLDIVGHLACQWPWTDNKRFSASIPQQDLSFASTMTFQTEDNAPKLVFSVADTEVSANISPGITEYLLTSPNLTLSCAGLNFVKPLVISATPFMPQLRGEFKHKIGKQEVSIDLPVFNAAIGEIPYVSQFTTTSNAFVIKLKDQYRR